MTPPIQASLELGPWELAKIKLALKQIVPQGLFRDPPSSSTIFDLTDLNSALSRAHPGPECRLRDLNYPYNPLKDYIQGPPIQASL